MKVIDLTGKKIGRLSVLRKSRKRSNCGFIFWLCKCECGAYKYVTGVNLRSGTQSCGCLLRERFTHRIHGGCGTVEYETWKRMKSRCYSKNNIKYPDYGGRGIEVCVRWRESFVHFLADMGPRPPNTSIDRYPNNDGNYEPGNCRWATSKEQMNNMRTNRLVTFNGKTQPLSAWAFDTGIKESTIRWRLASYWTTQEALTTITSGKGA